MLRIKSRQTGLSEGEYLRELINNSQPVEAPPRQFYEAMGQMSDIVSEIVINAHIYWAQRVVDQTLFRLLIKTPNGLLPSGSL